MIVHTAHLECRPEVIEPFRLRLALHARNSMEREPGCLSFRTFQSAENPALFLLVETYVDRGRSLLIGLLRILPNLERIPKKW